MIASQTSPSFKKIRGHLDSIVLPIQYAVDWPIRTVHAMATRLTTQQQLLQDDAQLRAHDLLLQAKLQELLVLERENAQLRELLKSTQRLGGKVLVAQILAVDLNPNLHQMIIDKGVNDHLYIGQPVLDSYGVVGQIVHVGQRVSKVMLATDPKNAIPIQDYRTSTRAIAVGDGVSGKLNLINVPNATDIQVGDLLVASGLALRYPVGYPVGVVENVAHKSDRDFAEISVIPSAHLNQAQQVIIAWPSKTSLAKDVKQELKTQLPQPMSNNAGGVSP